MKDDSDYKDSENPAPYNGHDFAARRTIIKGMASAVPVVMTIGCGQAMAQTSSSCIVPVEPPPPEGNGPKICLKDNETESPIYWREPVSPSQCAEPGGKHRLVYVDQDGIPTGGSWGDPVTNSCHQSFL